MSSVLNENHKRHLQSSFRYIDKLLSEAEHAMTDAGSPSPFREHADDTTPIQQKVTHDYIVRIREAMRRVMEENSRSRRRNRVAARPGRPRSISCFARSR